MEHIPEDDLECFHLGMVQDEAALALIEEHLLTCSQCVEAAYEAMQYVEAIRVALFRLVFSAAMFLDVMLECCRCLKFGFPGGG